MDAGDVLRKGDELSRFELRVVSLTPKAWPTVFLAGQVTHGAFKCESTRHTHDIQCDMTCGAASGRLSRGHAVCAGRNPVNRRCVLHNYVPSDRPLVRGQFREEAPRL